MKNYVKPLFLAGLFVFASSCEKETKVVNEIEDPDAVLETTVLAQKGSSWKRQFSDEFNKTVSSKKWSKTNRRDYNSSKCNYVSDNPKVIMFEGRSCLELSAYKYKNRYRSGHVKSKYKFKPKKNEQYRLSAFIKVVGKKGSKYKKFSETYGAWPAFWTVEEEGWPTGGEIDIMEGYSLGKSAHFASNLFYGTKTGENLLQTNCVKKYSNSEGWHKYELFWTNRQGRHALEVFVDNKRVAHYTNKIDNDLCLEKFSFHNIILNLNVGSDSGIFDNSKIKLFSKAYMYVDYVRVDKRKLN